MKRTAAIWLISSWLGTVVSCNGESGPADVSPDPDVHSAGVIYVDATAACPGTGSIDRPFCSLSRALAAGRAGVTIRISTGEFIEQVELEYDVTIIGSGYGSVIGMDGAEPTFRIEPGTRVTLRNLQVTGGISAESAHLAIEQVLLLSGGLTIGGGTTFVSGTTVRNSPAGGIAIVGGRFEMSSSSLEHTEAFGLQARDMENVIIRDSALSEGTGTAIRLENSHAELLGIQVRDTIAGENATEEPFAVIVEGGDFCMEGSSLVRSAFGGILLKGGTAQFVDCDFAGISGMSLAVTRDESGADAAAEVRDCRFEEVKTGVGVFGSQSEILRSSFRNTRQVAIGAWEDASVSIRNNLFQDLSGGAVELSQSRGTIRDNIVTTVEGRGLAILGSDSDVLIENNTLWTCIDAGVAVCDSRDVTLSGNSISSTRLSETTGRAEGILIERSLAIEISGNASNSNEKNGLFVVDGSSVRVTENAFRFNGEYGISIACESEDVDPSQVEVFENLFEGNSLGDLSACE